MDGHKKERVYLALACAAVSALVAVVTCGAYFSAAAGGQGVWQSAVQTVNINEPQAKKIDINTATAHELMTLPGVGETLAQRIVGCRPYADVWGLMDVEGVGGEIMRGIIDKVEVVDNDVADDGG
jgi:competence protein ComEA